LNYLNKPFHVTKKKYQLNLQREQEISSKKSQEQLLTIPPVKLKLNSIYPQKSSRTKNKRKSSSPTQTDDEAPSPQIDDQTPPPQIDDQLSPPPSSPQPPPNERPSLKITIRTKLPTSIPSSEEKNSK